MENRNGRGIFLGVVSVATLIVAIIGATFAYFSASVNAGNGVIAGNTLDVSASALSLSVTKLTTAQLGGSLPVNLQDLVPAAMTETEAGYLNAVNTKHCEDAGYTGCHVYEIDVDAANAVASATLSASLSKTGTDTNWSYALLQSGDIDAAWADQENPAPALATLKGTAHTFSSGASTDLVTESLNAGHTYYYLVVYLKNINASQNGAGDRPEGSTDTATDETGSYSGVITLKAAGGQVKATFTVNG